MSDDKRSKQTIENLEERRQELEELSASQHQGLLPKRQLQDDDTVDTAPMTY